MWTEIYCANVTVLGAQRSLIRLFRGQMVLFLRKPKYLRVRS